MTFDSLLVEIGRKAIKLRRNGDNLIISGENEALNPEFIDELRQHKLSLLNLLDLDTDKWWPPAITPEMLPLVQLGQEEIDRIVSAVPGGAANIQDIYPLAPLQEGILFHHLVTGEGDPYLLASQLSFDTRTRLDNYLLAMQGVIDRHDILRTAILWEGLSTPVQVVLRHAELSVTEVALDSRGESAAKQLYARFDPRLYRIDIRQAPLLRTIVAYDEQNDRWLMMLLRHHLSGDHNTLEIMQEEIQAHLLGHQDRLPVPLPFRNLVAQARLGVSQEEHERFFRKMLGNIDEPTAPFGLLDVQGDGSAISEARLKLDSKLALGMRQQARRLGVSPATLCHLAWAQVLASIAGRDEVVFGTVLFGRMQAGKGSDRVMGLFINTLPICIHVGQQGVEDGVRHTHTLLAELMHHEHASLAMAQRCSAVPAPTPLFSSLLNYRHSPKAARPDSADERRAWEGIDWLYSGERTNYPLTLSVDDLGDSFYLTVQVDDSIEPMRICHFMRTALEKLTETLHTSPTTPLHTLNALPEAERHKVLYEWNDTRTAFPDTQCIHQLFEEQVEKTPAAIAVRFEEASLSYEELNRRANQLAHYLRELGIRPDDRVALCVERGFEMIIALLAILKAGGAYVPLDPAYPPERLRFMLQDSDPVALITQGHLRGLFTELDNGLPFLDPNDENAPWKHLPGTNLDPQAIGLKPQHLAYVIYTSGSSGNPKGVLVEHRGVSNHLYAKIRDLGLSHLDKVAQTASPCFDISVWQFWAALLVGGKIVLATEEEAHDPTKLIHFLSKYEVTVFETVPLMLDAILQQPRTSECDLSKIRSVLATGESLSTNLGIRWVRAYGTTNLFNAYGPTECSDDVTHYVLTYPFETSALNIPIGRPIANTQIYILDAHRVAVPIGVTGELYIGGAGVARGYLNRPELTAERFLPDLFSSEAGARMYRTGDLGRWLPDGNIEFLGRNDFQVKIRGFRIELGEIEARLREHPSIREAFVIAREDTPGDKRLVAYYTASFSDAEESPAAEHLRAYLAEKLPEYMVPAAFVLLEAFPLTPNGKLDRKALPAPETDAFAVRAYEAPQGETETAIAALWMDLLKIDRIGRNDNFFELGGHSLLAVRVISSLQQSLKIKVNLSDLFAHPTLADFAFLLEKSVRTELLPITPIDRNGPLPLSFAQQRLWFLAQMEGVSEIYHIPLNLRFSGRLNHAVLRRALNRIVARHETLRTTFHLLQGEPVQRITPVQESQFFLLEHDLGQHSNPEEELYRLTLLEAGSSFHLATGPLIRGRLVRLSDEDHALLLTMHHIAFDGWSTGIFSKELRMLYAAFLENRADPLPELTVQYADYAAWQRKWVEGEVLQQQIEYWKNNLAGAPALLELPTDHPRPLQQGFAGAFAPLQLDEKLTTALKELSRRHGITLYMTMLTAWTILLARLSGQRDIVTGTPVANRSRAEIENLIGFFVNTLVLRIDLSDSPSVVELLARVKNQTLEALQHQDIPFEQVVEIMRPVRSLAHSPLFQVMFSWQNTEPGTFDLPALERKPVAAAPHILAKFDLTLSLGDTGDSIVGGLEYATVLFESSTIERYLSHFRTLLEAMVADESQSIEQLPLLTEAERHKVLYEWNDTRTAFPDTQCIHQLFEEQVKKTPAAIAVRFEEASLSYEELNRRANQLAHYLRELGIRPDDRVALCVERGFEMIIALLAILKAGGAYVPLDPAYPPERLRFMLQDSDPVALITQSNLTHLFPDRNQDLPLVDLQAPSPAWQQYPQHNPDPQAIGLKPQHLAYVIYTSGSSGNPKGVLVEHRNLSNLIHWHWNCFALKAGLRTSSLAGFGFDAAAWEIWPCLCIGATLVLASRVTVSDPEQLLNWCQKQDLDISFLPTPIAELAFERSITSNQLRILLVGGDKLQRLPDPPVSFALINNYGPTESTVVATSGQVFYDAHQIPIGRPIANTQIYILDAHRVAVPIGVTGELYIGGAGVARGYLNRPELTAERFLPDLFSSEAGARMYRTGDLGRWLPDGNIEFLGRNDFQVKIRGFRIELGEIEARLREHPSIREAFVIAREDTPGDKRLVAYYTASFSDAEESPAAEHLRAYLAEKLPEYMVPAAFVLLEAFPLTPNGKLDRKALPAPETDAFAVRAYEAPQGETETAIAALWMDLLKIDRIGRNDNFFELGGHSLLAVTLIERMRQSGLHIDVRAVFATPTLAAFAASVNRSPSLIEVPENRIPADSTAITPEMLPLVQLGQEEIDRIVSAVPGGAANIQDIYPLAPLQEGILFHHLVTGEGDPYLLASQLSFDTRTRLDNYLLAMQGVIDRHDILRTAILWEGLSTPVQVVLRHAELSVTEVALDSRGESAAKQLYARFDPRLYRIDIRQAPLLRTIVAYDEQNDRWLMMLLRHHLSGDHNTLEIMQEEIQAHLLGHQDRLPVPLPFRNLVAQARLGVSQEEHERFFRKMLGNIDEPTAPFGLLDVQGDGSAISEARLKLDSKLALGMRQQARRLGVSPATLCHLAWAQVLASIAGRDEVVFGTVLFGRMQAGKGSDRVMGLFINTLPICIHVGQQGVEDGVRHTHTLLAELMHHEHASLAMAQRCSAVPAPTPLFSSLLNYRHSPKAARPDSADERRAWEGIDWLYSGERTNYPLTLSVDDLGDSFYLTVQVDDSIEPMRICHFMRTALEKLTETLHTSPTTPLHTLNALPEAERHKVLYEWNDTRTAFPDTQCIHQLFEEQVEKTPAAIAVRFEEASLSYEELNRRANQLAHYLRELGIRPDDRVALCVERGFEMIIALLAILKAGGAYVPLDPAYPPERLRFMLQDSDPVALITQSNLTHLFPDRNQDLPLVDLQAPSPAWQQYPQHNPDPQAIGLKPQHLAYVIYTSGSSGNPKGVLVEHRNVTRLFTSTNIWFQFSQDDVWILLHSYAFDFSVWEIWGALLYSGRLIIAPKETVRSPAALFNLLCTEKVTFLNQTPSAFKHLIEAQAQSSNSHHLKYVVFGGESLEVASLKPWYERNSGDKPQLVNMYGITETTVHVTYRPLAQPDSENQKDKSIGCHISDLQIYILDAHRVAVPIGVTGELYIGGAGVARGYLNRPELTAERFLPDLFSSEAGARMYRTGDLGRWLPDGNIEFLGRNDFQVKIRGFRIELGEIEARLREHPSIREAFVIAREDTPGDKRLVAYYTASFSDAEESPAAEHLRAYLAEKLPEYMVPAAFVLLEAFPLTPNGKLDRKALPAPETDAFAVRAYEAPQGETETAIAALWMDLLKIDRIGRNDNFFELGGHSLLAVTLIERMRQSGLHIDVRAVFATPTLAAFAASVNRSPSLIEVPENRIPADSTAITPEMLPLVQLGQEEIDRIVSAVPGGAANIQDIYPLAPLQEGILFHHLVTGEGDPYLLASQLSFDTRTRLDNYLLAMQGVIDRHDILRTAILWEGLSTPVQVVLRHAELSVTEVALDSRGESAAKQLYARFDPRLYRIDIRQAPLLRTIVAYDEQNDRWLMMLLRHHLSGDHNTLEIMQEEIQAHLLGHQDRLPVPLPFRNLVAQARLGVSQEEHERFFRKMLGNIDEPTAPFGLLDVQGDGSAISEARLKLDSKLALGMRQQARRLGVSPATLCHLAWAQVLASIAGRDEVVFGTVLFGRMQAGKGSDRVMGLFINTLPICIHVGQQGVEDGVRHTHTLLAELMHHEHASLAMAQRCSAVPAPTPLFSSLLNYRHSPKAARPDSADERRAWEGIDWLYSGERTNYPLTLSVDDLGDSFYLTVQVDDSIEPMRICHFMRTALEKLTETLHTSPTTPLHTLNALPEAERHKVLYEWNDTRTAFPDTQCIHQLFEEQVEKTPAAIAVRFEEASLSYEELNRRANQLAHYLRELGIRPDDRVALCVERGFEMIIALLAILKAGGAYVPLDPAYPPERLRFMLQDSDPVALITQSNLTHLFPDRNQDLPLVDLQAPSPAWQQYPQHNPDPQAIGLKPQHLAYVIYTSGSSGNPKGVLVEHRNIANYTLGVSQRLGLEFDLNYALVSSITTDLGNTTLFPSLTLGGSLHILSEPLAMSEQEMSDYFARNTIDVLKIVPQHLAALQSDTQQEGPIPRRFLILGGDSTSIEWIKRLRPLLPTCEIYNHYGPTETTVGVLTYHVGPALPNTPSGTLPLGRPLPNSLVYILDKHGAPVPIGVEGELFIGGAGVARGYLNRPELTAERFLPDLFSSKAGARMYRTGDLGRWLPDGNIEFLGRNDFQVKIRGFRVELAEVEEALRKHPGIRDCAVITQNDALGEKRLTAYIITKTKAMSLWKSDNLYLLPDGSPVAHLNKYETEYIYHEIFILQAYLRYGITIHDGDCIIDAGANIGLFSLFCSRVARQLTIYSFEPNPAAFGCLKANARIADARIKCLPFGLSSEDTIASMTSYEGFSLLSGFFADSVSDRDTIKHYALNQQPQLVNDLQLATGVGEIIDDRLRARHLAAELRTLSSVIKAERINHIDLLKINVEKSELHVLQGIHPNDWPKIRQVVLEVDKEDNLKPILHLLQTYGFDTATEQDALLTNTHLRYIYARRGNAFARLKLEQQSDSHLHPLFPASTRALAPIAIWHFLSSSLPEYMIPTAYVQLDKFPLTSSGKLSRKLLPLPEESVRTHHYEPPRGYTEIAVASIWAEVLRINLIGRYDNFFDLGGHSLLALRVINQLQGLGMSTSYIDLFRYPTISALSQQLDSRRQNASSKFAVCIRSRASRTPLFLTHCGGGEIIYTPILAKHIEPDIDIYALPATSLEEPSLKTVPEMATRMIHMILAIQPSGPYRIAGWSFGGLCAYEIAVQLLKSSQTVDFLALIDTGYDIERSELAKVLQNTPDYKSILLNHIEREFVDINHRQKEAIVEIRQHIETLTFGNIVERVRNQAMIPERFSILTPKQIESHLARSYAYNLASLDYIAPAVQIPVHVFSAQHDDNIDSTLYWDTVISKQLLRMIPTPGTHQTMMWSPNIEILGKKLSRALHDSTASS